MYGCDLGSLKLLACVCVWATCDTCVTSTDAGKAYKVALGGGLFPWGSN